MRRALLLVLPFLTLAAVPIQSKGPYQHYPNIPGEILFENDRLVVQKFIVERPVGRRAPAPGKPALRAHPRRRVDGPHG